MTSIAIVSNQKSHSDFVKKDLSRYFKDYATINSYSVSEIKDIKILNEKCIIISSFNIFQKVKEKASVNSEIVINKLTAEKKYLKKLDAIPKKSKVLVVNVTFVLCMEVISTLYAYGYKDYQFIPYHNLNDDYDANIEFAVTPNEKHLIPKGIKHVIDIGDRVCSFSVILEIANALKINNFTEDEKIKKILYDMETTDNNIASILGEKNDLKIQVNTVLELMEYGIIITDVSGIILSYNSKAKNLLKDRTNHLENFNVSDILPELVNIKSITQRSKKEEKILIINDKRIVVTFIPISTSDFVSGFIITLVNFEEAEDKQNVLRSKLSFESHKTRYTFDSIKGQSNELRKVIGNAKTMASSDSSIMIFGESGTGKEVFAQSIHNLSKRKKNNFVAVNCAAIPENLLESEMFGYEEGAFTGAKKGGKIGYFELAHSGTLFLDEISEMPLLMQPKLLRAIEDRSIIKVGSNKIVYVDIRIIASTNKDLRKLVGQGEFREDLYYRLNVLPLNIPSLRVRNKDIMILAKYFADTMNMNGKFSSEAEEAMVSYAWKGNIRELRNVMEYLKNLNKSIIDIEDLPFYDNFDHMAQLCEASENNINYNFIMNFILREGKKIDLYKLILQELEKAYINKKRIGRAKLVKIAEKSKLFHTEQEIRSCLIKLSDFGFIVSSKGTGSIITGSGIMLKKKIVELLG